MLVPSKPMLAITLFSFIISCGNLEGDKQTTNPIKNTIPSSERKKSELPTSKPENLEPIKAPIQKEEKEKKLKKIDTLKPVVIIP